jgi:hypothetical protein
MAVSVARSVERSRVLALDYRLPALAGFGFRTTCQRAGASPWPGSKELRDRATQILAYELAVRIQDESAS